MTPKRNFWVSLLPKVREEFAEFLHYGSLKRLRRIDVFTCVGLEYGDDTGKLYPERLFQEKKIFVPFLNPLKFAFANLLRGRLTLRRFAERRNL